MIPLDFSLGFRKIYSRWGIIRDETELRYRLQSRRAFEGRASGERRHFCADSEHYCTTRFSGSVAYSSL